MAFIAPLVTGIGSLLGGAGGAAAGVGAAASSGISIGTVLQAGAGILGGISAINAANYQSQVAKNNAKIAEQNAKLASEQGQESAKQQDLMTASVVGEQLASQGASGLSVSSPSSVQTRAAARRLGRQDAYNTYSAGGREATNYLNQAQDFRSSAANIRAQGTGALFGSFLDAGGSLIGKGFANRVQRPNKFIPTPTARPRFI